MMNDLLDGIAITICALLILLLISTGLYGIYSLATSAPGLLIGICIFIIVVWAIIRVESRHGW